MTQEQFKRMIDCWGFSERHLRITWEKLKNIPQEVKDDIIEYEKTFTLDKNIVFSNWEQNRPNGLFIYSSKNGTGKTSLAHQIAKDLIGTCGIKKMRFLGGVEMFLELKKTFNPHGGINESDVLDSILQSDIFFLDDFDKLIKWTAYERERATLIFDKCYNQMKPVIITSNKSLQELVANNQLEPHLYSRFSEMCKVIEIKDGKDYRLKVNSTVKGTNFV